MTEHRITRLGHQGDGIADGPVFAAMTLPGEVVTGTLDGARLTDVRVIVPSDDRVRAPCRHFRSCGGCQMQHASDAFLAGWKVDVVRTALEAHGVQAAFLPVVTSPAGSRRRATLAARRTKKGAMAGFHAKGSDVIVGIPDCRLLHPDLMAALPLAEAMALAGTSRKATLAVAATLSDSGLDVTVAGGKPPDATLRTDLAQLADRHDLARLVWDDEVIALRRAPGQRFGPARVVPPPGAFLQATAEGEAALLAHVSEVLGAARHVVDLFAGCGTFSLPLTVRAQVHAVEGDAAMLAALAAGWRGEQGLRTLTTEARDLFRRPLRPDELARFDAAVIDPPRVGAERQVAELVAARVPVIAAVSCNPVSFARDAATLTVGGYRMGPVQVVDQFRWSTHVELAAGFHLA